MERGRWESVDGEWVDEEEDVRGDEKVEMRDMLATGKSYEELVTEYQEASGRHPDQRVEEGEEVGMVPQPLFWQRDSMLSGQLADDEGRKDNGMKGGKKRSFSGGFRKHEKPSAMSMPLKLMLTSGNGRYSPDASFDGKAATSVKSPTRSVRFRDRSTSRKSSKSSKSSKEKKKRTPLMPPLTLHLPKKLVGAAKPAKPVHKDDKTSQKSVSLPRLKHASLGPRLRKTPTIEGRDWSERGYDPRLHPSTMNSNTPTTLSVPPLLSNEPVVFSGLIDRASKIRPVNVKTDSASSGTPSSSFSPVTPVSPRSNRSSLLAQVVEKAWSTSVLGHRRHDRNVSVKSNLSTSINQGSKVEEKMEENRRKRASSLKSMRPAFLSRKLEGRRELERERRREELKKSIRFVGQIDPHARASYVRDEEHGLKAPSSPRSLKSKGWI
ncbi:hypothetical protein M501DRAFT_996616 [Patellaria atrata CBS 101060]|uniref:Uncharacterized protein n=1 Tax=Patellaria atrata CBS 101060 TaxID=1346257 RepID=A0A9P4S5U2_9PEZI|nr:hypothetical protein M501DRAFT_996616 [Patellaria atrata CBS 101060]